MATEVASGYVELGARIGKLEAGFAEANRQLDRFGRAAEAHSRRADMAARSFRRGAAVGALAVAAGFGAAVRVAATFEQQMNQLGAVSNASAADLGRLRGAALRLGASTKFSAREVAGAQTELAKAGLTTGQILGGGLKAALSLAAAGNLEVADAAAFTSNAMNQFGLRAGAATRIADAFAAAANTTSADVKDFGIAITQGGAAARAAGLNFTETMVALTALAKGGVRGSDAGTSLKAALTQVAKPTREARQEMQRLGVSFFDAHGRMRSMTDISGQLRRAWGDLTHEQRLASATTIAGTDGQRTLLALYNAGPATLDRYGQALTRQGSAAQTAARMNQGAAAAWEQFTGALESAGIILATSLLPVMTEAAQGAARFVDELAASGDLQSFAADMGTVVSGAFEALTATMRALAPVAATVAAAISGVASTQLAPMIMGAVAALVALRTALLAAAAAQAAFNAAASANKWVALGAVIFTVIGAFAGYRLAAQASGQATNTVGEAAQRAAAAVRGLQDALDGLQDANLRATSAQIELRAAQQAHRQVQAQIAAGALKGAAARDAEARAALNLRRAEIEAGRATRAVNEGRREAVQQATRLQQHGLARIQTLTREVTALNQQKAALIAIKPGSVAYADAQKRLAEINAETAQKQQLLNQEIRKADGNFRKANRLLAETAQAAGPAGEKVRGIAQAFQAAQKAAKADAFAATNTVIFQTGVAADVASGKVRSVGLALAAAAAQATALAVQAAYAASALAALPSNKTVTVTTRRVETGGKRESARGGRAPAVTVDEARALLGSTTFASLTDAVSAAQEFGLTVRGAADAARFLNAEIQQTDRLQRAVLRRQQAQQQLDQAKKSSGRGDDTDRRKAVAAATRALTDANRDLAAAERAAGGGLQTQRAQLAQAAQGARGARASLQQLTQQAITMNAAIASAFSRFRDQQLAAVDAPYQDGFRRIGAGIQLVRGLFSQLDQQQDQALAAVDRRVRGQLDGIEAWRQAFTPAEAAIRGIQDAASEQGLRQGLEDARQEAEAARLAGDWEEHNRALRRVADAEREIRLAELQKTADQERTARDREADRQKTAAEEAADRARQAVQDEFTARRMELEAQQSAERAARQQALDDMERQLQRIPAILAEQRGRNTPELVRLRNQFATFGESAGSNFVANLIGELDKVGSGIARTLARRVQPYLELHSPAKRGPLSEIDRWWRPLGETLMAGAGPEVEAQIAAMRTPPVSAGASVRGGGETHLHVHLEGTYLGDDRRLVEDLARVLKPAIDRQVTVRV